jgi:hypothetical protein
MGWWTSVLSDWQKNNNKKSHETVPLMIKHLLAGAKNTLSQCHTGEKCHTGTNYSYPGMKLNNIFSMDGQIVTVGKKSISR